MATDFANPYDLPDDEEVPVLVDLNKKKPCWKSTGGALIFSENPVEIGFRPDGELVVEEAYHWLNRIV